MGPVDWPDGPLPSGGRTNSIGNTELRQCADLTGGGPPETPPNIIEHGSATPSSRPPFPPLSLEGCPNPEAAVGPKEKHKGEDKEDEGRSQENAVEEGDGDYGDSGPEGLVGDRVDEKHEALSDW